MSNEPNTEDERTGARVAFRVEVAASEGREHDLVTAAQLEAITALLLEGSRRTRT